MSWRRLRARFLAWFRRTWLDVANWLIESGERSSYRRQCPTIDRRSETPEWLAEDHRAELARVDEILRLEQQSDPATREIPVGSRRNMGYDSLYVGRRGQLSSSERIYRGPRGSRYRINRYGRKSYDVP